MSPIDHYPLRVYGLVALLVGLAAILVVLAEMLPDRALVFTGDFPYVPLLLVVGWVVLAWMGWDLWKYVKEKQGVLA